jgi:N-glycosylase/DNA lyase
MTQSAAVFFGCMVAQIELPSPGEEVLPGLRWGAIDAFPTPAYWAYQVMARRIAGQQLRYRLGNTLAEEVGACLLGGHGIRAGTGLAFFRHLRDQGAFARATSESDLTELLSQPVEIDGRAVRYRFARQKAHFISCALKRLYGSVAPTSSGRSLRDWLMEIPGVGPKTASWVARNWLDADDVAILDIHILRAGDIAGFFRPGLKVERDYLVLEQQLLRFSEALGVRASELDSVIWHEMMSSPGAVRDLLTTDGGALALRVSATRADECGPDAMQARPTH